MNISASRGRINRRTKTIIIFVIILLSLLVIAVAGLIMGEASTAPDFTAKNLPPSLKHIFGTDWMGRDMLSRTIKGLSVSIIIGIIASSVSAVMAVIIGAAAGTLPKWADDTINWFIDLVMGIPHIVLLILISFAVGKGLKGVLIGVAATHWTSLARLMRSEVLQIRGEQYIRVSKSFGKSNLWIMTNHILPHMIPQFIVGLVLLFPHAILHEASITFLGFGLSPEQPAIGIILSESMKYLSTGMWWLAFFPGVMLVLIVVLFDKLGENLKALIDPFSTHE